MKKILFLLINFFFFSTSFYALTDISVSNNLLVPIFDNNTKVYNVFVNSDVEIVSIIVKSEKNEVVTGSGSVSLKEGINVFELFSYIDNVLIDKYTINITRGNTIYDKSSSYLSSLSIEGVNLEFNKNVFEYNIEVNEIDKLNISYVTENPSAYVKVSGDVFLNKNENNINIKVISSNNENSTTYKIKAIKNIKDNIIKKKKSIFDNKDFSSFELKLIIIGLISLGIIVILVLFYFVFIKKYKTYNIFKKN